jgi:UDP-2-acetamido-3-amino-2,3-dideoxy-glucuronate N-acetyltransferase
MDDSAALLECVESCESGAAGGSCGRAAGTVEEPALAPCSSHNERGERAEQSGPVAGIWCHETACVEQPSIIGPGTRIGPYAHVMAGATVGSGCRIGRNVVIAPTAVVGDNVTIGHNVVVEDGVVLEADVVCAPGVVFATVRLPRAVPQLLGSEKQSDVGDETIIDEEAISSPPAAKRIVVRQHAILGANATILGGVTVDIYSVVGAGAVVTSDVPSYAVVTGVPARRLKWLCRCTRHSLNLDPRSTFNAVCPTCHLHYRLIRTGAEEYSAAEERRRRKADLYRIERRFVESITPSRS